MMTILASVKLAMLCLLLVGFGCGMAMMGRPIREYEKRED